MKNGAHQQTKDVVNFSCLRDQSCCLRIICNSISRLQRGFEATKKIFFLFYAVRWRNSLIRDNGKSLSLIRSQTHSHADTYFWSLLGFIAWAYPCGHLCVPLYTFWASWRIFLKLGMLVMLLEAIIDYRCTNQATFLTSDIKVTLVPFSVGVGLLKVCVIIRIRNMFCFFWAHFFMLRKIVIWRLGVIFVYCSVW
jgi:hypothetical protein